MKYKFHPAAERGVNAYRDSACSCACSTCIQQALGGAHYATVHGARRSMAASGNALAAAAPARALARFHRAACYNVTDGHHGRAPDAALRAVMVKRARSKRSTLPMSCSAFTRRASATRCVRDARARQLAYWRPVRAAAQYGRLCAARHWL